MRAVLRERPASERFDRRAVCIARPAHEVVSLRRLKLNGKHAHQRPGAYPGLTEDHGYQRDAETALGRAHRGDHGVELDHLPWLGARDAHFLGPTAPGARPGMIDDQWQGTEHLTSKACHATGMLRSADRSEWIGEQPRAADIRGRRIGEQEGYVGRWRVGDGTRIARVEL